MKVNQSKTLEAGPLCARRRRKRAPCSAIADRCDDFFRDPDASRPFRAASHPARLASWRGGYGQGVGAPGCVGEEVYSLAIRCASRWTRWTRVARAVVRHRYRRTRAQRRGPRAIRRHCSPRDARTARPLLHCRRRKLYRQQAVRELAFFRRNAARSALSLYRLVSRRNLLPISAPTFKSR